MNASDYYLLVNNEETGPFALEQVKEMVERMKISLETLYAQPGMSAWKPLLEIIPPRPVAPPSATEQTPGKFGLNLRPLWERAVIEAVEPPSGAGAGVSLAEFWEPAIVSADAAADLRRDALNDVQRIIAQAYSRTAMLLGQPERTPPSVWLKPARDLTDHLLTPMEPTTQRQFREAIQGANKEGMTRTESAQQARGEVERKAPASPAPQLQRSTEPAQNQSRLHVKIGDTCEGIQIDGRHLTIQNPLFYGEYAVSPNRLFIVGWDHAFYLLLEHAFIAATGVIPGGFVTPCSVKVADNGNFVLNDDNNHEFFAFSASGELLIQQKSVGDGPGETGLSDCGAFAACASLDAPEEFEEATVSLFDLETRELLVRFIPVLESPVDYEFDRENRIVKLIYADDLEHRYSFDGTFLGKNE